MKILIAEDDLISRKMLSQFLISFGYEVISTCDGKEAWAVLQKSDAPNLAILDWMMPYIDGVELCKKVRNLNNTKPFYLILLTALSDKQSIINGLNAGANDYIAKPFNKDELKARIEVGFRVIKLECNLAKNNEKLSLYANEMEKLANERAKQLIHADRMATVGILSAGIAHEINNPTTFIAGNMQVLKESWPVIKNSLRGSLEHGNPDSIPQLKFCIEETPKIIDGVMNGVQRIRKIVNGLKTYSRQSKSEKKPIELNKSIDQALEMCKNRLKYNIKIEKKLSSDLPDIIADHQQIEQVLINIITNAADAIEEKRGKGELFIETSALEDGAFVVIKDNGTGFDAKTIDNLFKPFFTTKRVEKGTGLGLSISQNIIEEHGGKILAENRKSGGACITVILPTENLR